MLVSMARMVTIAMKVLMASTVIIARTVTMAITSFFASEQAKKGLILTGDFFVG